MSLSPETERNLQNSLTKSLDNIRKFNALGSQLDQHSRKHSIFKITFLSITPMVAIAIIIIIVSMIVCFNRRRQVSKREIAFLEEKFRLNHMHHLQDTECENMPDDTPDL